MIKKRPVIAAVLLTMACLVNGCSQRNRTDGQSNSKEIMENTMGTQATQSITLDARVQELDKGFSAVQYQGDYEFDTFLSSGGAVSDAKVIEFLTNRLLFGAEDLSFDSTTFGCSTIAVQSPTGEALFGRNFDWQNCEAMAVASYPDNGFASISTVNMDFIRQGAGSIRMALMSEEMRTLAALYAPLDGMNEKGLVVSVNMIQDSATINQNTEKPDLTTTTAVRALLNGAANVEEAVELLEQYDMHASMNYMVHFALADTSGKHVVVEYINNEMVVTETPVVTNFYLAEGTKYGIGTAQSHTRYDILTKRLQEKEQLTMDEVGMALDSVSKDDFGEFESTEWSIVFNQTTGQVRYYHRENYQHSYTFQL